MISIYDYKGPPATISLNHRRLSQAVELDVPPLSADQWLKVQQLAYKLITLQGFLPAELQLLDQIEFDVHQLTGRKTA